MNIKRYLPRIWHCPNILCGALNYFTDLTCRICGREKP